MKPLRTGDLTNSGPVDWRGRRTPADVLGRTIRDHLLRIAAERHLSGLSDRQAAEMLRTKLTRYAAGSWRRDRVEDLCPARHHGRIEALLWETLRTRDMIPSSRTIRKALAGGFTRPTD
jgi:hypothetical protein